jgi:KipI family sensor histidine kinase inhibitor
MRITLLGDAALLVEYEHAIDLAVNARVLAAADRVRHEHVTGVRDVVPAYASFAVHYDPVHTDLDTLRNVVGQAAVATATEPVELPCGPVEIPVCYGGRFGPDLNDVAAWAGCAPDEVIAAHALREYRVFMLGFLPGFPYLGTVDDRIAMPRHRTPRRRVPAGSVGIAGRQTGVYPVDSPGGWRIIGRTPLVLFDVRKDPPALLSPGQWVQFRPLSASEFDAQCGPGGPR